MRRPVSTRQSRSARTASLRVEALEVRRLLTADLLQAVTPIMRNPAADLPIVRLGLTARPVAAPGAGSATYLGPVSASPSAIDPAVRGPFTPAQIRHAYGVDQLSYDGTGQTIAIIDAYDNPTIASDLAAFNSRFGLPAANLIVAKPQGTPIYDSGWATESALDVEWAHAIAPKATILLVEALDSYDTSLLNAVDYAVNAGANQISMSWGGGEDPNGSTDDGHFNRSGVTFLASAGDNGTEVESPAVSPYVTSVGGTTLTLDSAGNRTSETVWSGSGGGLSAYVNRPAFQAGFVSGSRRGVPDVSYDANPSTGVYVNVGGSWYTVGGTSAGAPQWAGLIALVNQGRAAAGKAPLGTGQAFGTNSVLYGLAGGSSYTNPGGDFLDITSGSNGTSATTGYDTATGLGSPVANLLVPDLVGPPPAPAVPTLGDAGFESISVGSGAFGDFAYDPTGSAWSFAGHSGVSGNGSGFTNGNPAAPQGTQVAILQDTGSFAQSVASWSAGTYAVTFLAARRGNYGGAEDFQVVVDGTVVGTFKPTGTGYQAFTTASFTVAAGAHSVAFRGLGSDGGDDAALIDSVAVVTATGTNVLPPAAPTPGDAGFEAVSVGSGAFGDFAYDPTGSAWSFAGHSGVSGNGSGFTNGNPAAPQGTQVAILQDTGSFAQSVASWSAGTYAVTFLAARRGNYGGAEDFQVVVDGTVVGTFKPTGTGYQAFTTASFTVAAGAHSVAFRGLGSDGGDDAALIDSVAVVTATGTNVLPPAAPTPGDAGFESISVGSGAFGDFAYDPTGSAWSFAGHSGVSGNGSGFTNGNPAAPQGTQVAILQDTGSFAQSVASWSAGTYAVTFLAARRGNYGGAEDFQVVVDGTVVGTFKPTGTGYQAFTTASFTVAAGAHSVAFRGLGSDGGDDAALIDSVAVVTAS